MISFPHPGEIMRSILGSLLIASFVTVPADAFQAKGGSAVVAAPKACSILTRDLALPLTENPKILDLLPPEEEPFGNGGTACQYGGVRLQLYPPRTSPAKTQPKDFQPLTGVGELAYFHSNRDRYAELMVWSGTSYFTLQVSVPTGATAEAIKPKTIVLANQIIAKLK
jgi:hypothetical protein